MSLWLVEEKAPCFDYIDFGSCFEETPVGWVDGRLWYSGELVTCPKHYLQTTGSIPHFYYDPGEDCIKMLVIYTTVYYPSWDVQLLKFSPDDGSWLNRAEVLARTSFAGIWGVAYTNHATMGSYNKIYATRNETTRIVEVDQWLQPVVGGWGVSPQTWTPPGIYGFAVVNRQDQLLTGASSWFLDHWRNINSTPEKIGTTKLPSTVSYMCWESRNYLWVISPDGSIHKVDYQVPRYEMLSTVQNPQVTSTGFRITFDTKRKRVVVLRMMPDDTEGACQHRLEFYYPMVKPVGLTKPVPINSLRSGNPISFVSHLYGAAGEGVTPFTVNAELAPGAVGALKTPFAGTERNGRVVHRYQPDGAAEETIEISMDYTEG